MLFCVLICKIYDIILWNNIHSKSVVYNIAVILLITNTLYYYTGKGYWQIGYCVIRSVEPGVDLHTAKWQYLYSGGVYKPDNTMTIRYEPSQPPSTPSTPQPPLPARANVETKSSTSNNKQQGKN